MTDVADNSIVGHGLEMCSSQDISAAGGGNENLTLRSSLLHGGNLEAGDGSLESVDGIDLSDNDTGTHAVESLSAALADITETSNNGDLASNHNISGPLDTVDKRFTAAVEVVELGLGNGVVDVDGWDKETLALEHSVEMVDTSGGLLRDTIAVLEHLGVLLVDKGGQVTTVVKDQVQALAILEGGELLLQAPLVLLLSLALPGEYWHTGGGNGGSSVVLCGEDVAGSPGQLSTESLERLDQNGGLDGLEAVSRSSQLGFERRTHVQASSNTSALQWLIVSILLASLHETGHLILSKLNLAATKGRETNVGDLELVGGSRHFGG